MGETVFGWNSMEELTADIWNSIHSSLLYGDFMFAARNGSGCRVVISKRPDGEYMVGTVTPGWTSLQPKMPLEQLREQVPSDLKEFKFNKTIIEKFLKLL